MGVSDRARTVAPAERLPCPLCPRRPSADCILCRGSGTFDAELLAGLRRLRERRRVTLAQLGLDLEVSATALSRLERGETLRARSWSKRQAAGRLLRRYLLMVARAGGMS